jgi:hypothetical protein
MSGLPQPEKASGWGTLSFVTTITATRTNGNYLIYRMASI